MYMLFGRAFSWTDHERWGGLGVEEKVTGNGKDIDERVCFRLCMFLGEGGNVVCVLVCTYVCLSVVCAHFVAAI